MKNIVAHTGFAIALAWPQTYCKQPGAWYDPITLFLGINQNNYYKVGHAALVLIDSKKQKAHYFDFGRYHAPYKYGRVRSAETDHDLAIKTVPKLSEDGQVIENYKDILYEIQNNPACHGEGELYASYSPIHYQLSYAKVIQMQENSPIPYGPFRINGSNCSRFVNSSILAGKPHFRCIFNLKYCIPLTPTPISNVKALKNRIILAKLSKDEPFFPFKRLENHLLSATLPAPDRYANIPENAQWLSGEGAGSWFNCNVFGKHLKVIRYSPKGIIECSGLYKSSKAIHHLSDSKDFSVIYPSNCRTVSLIIKGSKLFFHRI